MADTFYRLYVDSKRVLHRDGSLSTEAVAELCGFSERMTMVDERIKDTIESARRDVATDAEETARLSAWQETMGGGWPA